MQFVDSIGSSVIFIVIFCLCKQRIVNQTIDLSPAVCQPVGSVRIGADMNIGVTNGLCQIGKRCSIGFALSTTEQEMIIGIKFRPARFIDKLPSHHIGFLDDPVKAGFQLLCLTHT